MFQWTFYRREFWIPSMWIAWATFLICWMWTNAAFWLRWNLWKVCWTYVCWIRPWQLCRTSSCWRLFTINWGALSTCFPMFPKIIMRTIRLTMMFFAALRCKTWRCFTAQAILGWPACAALDLWKWAWKHDEKELVLMWDTSISLQCI